MRILVVTLLYQPDGGPSAPLFTMLCEGLATRGHEVAVIAAVPHYPSGRVQGGFRHRWLQQSLEGDVRVIRVPVPSVNRDRLPLRLIQFLAYQVEATIAGLAETYDAILVTNPALSKGLPFAALAALRRKPSVYFVADIYPDVGVQAGIFRRRPMAAAVAAMERFCLRRADYVWIFSDSFTPSMRAMGVARDRLELIPAWVDTGFIRPLARHNAFSQEHELDGRFVVLYAGNLGLSQGLEGVLLAAQSLSGRPDITFVFVGQGAGRPALVRRAEELALGNLRFIPFQPRERVPEVLATADVSLISLMPGVGNGSIPSKSYAYLASGRPLLAFVDPGCAVWSLVERSGAGLCVPSPDARQLAEAICELQARPALRQQMGRNGRAWAVRYHSPQIAAARVESLLQRAVERHGG